VGVKSLWPYYYVIIIGLLYTYDVLTRSEDKVEAGEAKLPIVEKSSQTRIIHHPNMSEFIWFGENDVFDKSRAIKKRNFQDSDSTKRSTKTAKCLLNFFSIINLPDLLTRGFGPGPHRCHSFPEPCGHVLSGIAITRAIAPPQSHTLLSPLIGSYNLLSKEKRTEW